MKVLVTGAAGFIGFHTVISLLNRGDEVIGIDNLNDYYDVNLKKARLKQIETHANNLKSNFKFYKVDLSNQFEINKLFSKYCFNSVINLAAQAGVRYSTKNPHAYINSNIVGFLNILESCRHHNIEHLVYASSSSVYGANGKLPFSVSDSVDHPLSLYAASKKSNELMAHSYSNLYGLPTTGLRFFTVYGPWGRPDMALFLFTKSILSGEKIDVYNEGNHIRDFTYIDDIVAGIIACLDSVPEASQDWDPMNPNPGFSFVPWKVYNIGNSKPTSLREYIEVLEKELGKTADKNYLPLQPGDVPSTAADVSSLIKDTGYSPSTSINFGIKQFVNWYLDFYKN